ncbi:hypothetical protein PN499_28640 [Kamptonema animale CS-326]|uniref:hypothetical protein n=1 Tax=Kamptonema animale TaxID=92934 RepID=UPI002330E7D6|nr:hypothetical protein [Kamptonema animale]MDB9515174.1 hypothetical protein [Kamptonema animale CS-326]
MHRFNLILSSLISQKTDRTLPHRKCQQSIALRRCAIATTLPANTQDELLLALVKYLVYNPEYNISLI